MTTDETRIEATDDAPAKPWQARAWLLLIAVLCIGPIYMAVMMGIRAHVTHEIVSNEKQPIPSFALRTLDGQTVRSEDLIGRTTILHFFRSQCATCFAEAPYIRALAGKLDPNVARIYGVFLDPVRDVDPAMSRETLAEMAFEHPIMEADAAFVDAFHGVAWSHVTPVTYVVDPDGVITRAIRAHDPERLESALPEGALTGPVPRPRFGH
jgi:peroxiredoxin